MRTNIALTVSLLCLALLVFFIASSPKVDNDAHYEREIKMNYRNYALPIPKYIDFCGDVVPVDRLDVRESLDRELLVNTYWHSQTFLFFKRANRYFPVIEPILSAHKVPDDFKYLALIESGFANVVSPAGASGFWQFMKATAQRYDLVINDEVDERYNLEKATKAACQYLLNSYRLFNSWTLAAAAYNMGDNGLRNQLNRQNVTDYYDLHLNQETARYVFRILAIKAIFENPKLYGFYFRESDLYPPVKTEILYVDTSIENLSMFALEQGINFKILREYNPWLRKQTLTNKEKRTYEIHIPKAEEMLYSFHFPHSQEKHMKKEEVED